MLFLSTVMSPPKPPENKRSKRSPEFPRIAGIVSIAFFGQGNADRNAEFAPIPADAQDEAGNEQKGFPFYRKMLDSLFSIA